MLSVFNNVKIKAISAGTGSVQVTNEQKFGQVLEERQFRRFIKSIGFKSIKHIPYDKSFLDLSLLTVQHFSSVYNFDLQDVDLIISSTQSPDSLIPCNSFILHDKLNLKAETLNMDLIQGCAGFAYALMVASSLIESRAINRALVIVGDNDVLFDHDILNKEDLEQNVQFRNAGIFASGCGVCLLEYQANASPLYFSYIANSKAHQAIYNYDYAKKHLVDKTEHFRGMVLDGEALANFVLNDVPQQISALFDFAHIQKEDILYYFAHQANFSLINSLRMVLKLDDTSLPFMAENTGNTESASIPLGICENLEQFKDLDKDKYSLMIGFGTGLFSCGVLANLKDTKFFKPVVL